MWLHFNQKLIFQAVSDHPSIILSLLSLASRHGEYEWQEPESPEDVYAQLASYVATLIEEPL